MKRICLVEDESSISEMIRLNLEMENYEVTLFDNGQKASDHFTSEVNYDLFILDVMLPGVSGVELCKTIRSYTSAPVLFLSAKGTTVDRIEGLKAGANDYLPKPFDLEELLLRVAVLTQSAAEEVISIGNWEVDLKTFMVSSPGNETSTQLSKKEMALIQLFHEREGEVVARTEILDRIWGTDQYPTTRTIDNFILNFRKIFEEDPRNPQHFLSVRGVGYKFMR